MRVSSQIMTEGARFVVALRGQAAGAGPLGPTEPEIAGELVLTIGHAMGENRSLRTNGFALVVSSVPAADGESGVLSLAADELAGVIAPGYRDHTFELSGPCRLHYPALDRSRGLETTRGCYYLPATLPAWVSVRGRVEEGGKNELGGPISLAFTSDAIDNEALTTLHFNDDLPWEPLDVNTSNCPPGLSVDRYRLAVQPVGFRTSPADASPSGSTAAAQLASASLVWGKCCVELQVNPIHIVTHPTLKTSSDLNAIRASYTHPDTRTIEIFFVQNPLASVGGGNAGALGEPGQKLVVAEPNAGNHVLVAHELGHALGLGHPPESDAGSVMQPTGGAAIDGTELVSHHMANNISQPALQIAPGPGMCCLSHDIADHFLRDFPEDVGNQPSEPMPAGRNRYSMSNVWNRITDSPGPFGAAGPDHQNPVRFANDGATPYENYLWARVEQRHVLRVRDGEVRFYLKHPGSGGGALNLRLLGQVPVPAVIPANVRIRWMVPTDSPTPNHSCVFAVVGSPSEPAPDLGALAAQTWQQFEAAVREDNDWAQRNLSIRNTVGTGNTFHGAPIVVQVPEDTDRKELTLRVDARRAQDVDGLLLRVGPEAVHDLLPGGVTEIELTARHPYVPLIVQGVWPTKAPDETGYSVGVDIRLAGEELVGYGWSFRQPRRPALLGQLVDALLSGLDDLVALLDIDAACRIACILRVGRREGCTTTTALVGATREAEDAFRGLADALDDNAHARAFGIRSTVDAWLDSTEPDEQIELLLTLGERLQLVAWGSALFPA